MDKIKIIIFSMLLVVLLLLGISHQITKQSEMFENFTTLANEQKSRIQNISKNIFYLHKNKNVSDEELTRNIEKFADSMQNEAFASLKKTSQVFHENAQAFLKQKDVTTPYKILLLKDIIKKNYSLNQTLLQKLNELIDTKHRKYQSITRFFGILQYFLYAALAILLGLLVYRMYKATKSIDYLIKKIDNTIESIDHIEKDAELYFEQVGADFDENALINEDAIINSLDELIHARIRLQKLQKDLQTLKKS